MYALKAGELAGFILIEILSDSGEILFKKDFTSFTGAKKYIQKAFGDIEWVTQPWADERIKAAKAKYQHRTGLPYNGKMEERETE